MEEDNYASNNYTSTVRKHSKDNRFSRSLNSAKDTAEEE